MDARPARRSRPTLAAPTLVAALLAASTVATPAPGQLIRPAPPEPASASTPSDLPQSGGAAGGGAVAPLPGVRNADGSLAIRRPAGDAPAAPPTAVTQRPSAPSPTPGEPASAGRTGPRFDSEAVGVAFDVPAGLEEVSRAPAADEFARYVSPEPATAMTPAGDDGPGATPAAEDDLRALTARRLVFDRPTPLTTDEANGLTRVGLLETLAAEVAGDSDRRTLRQERVNLNGADAGLIAVLHRAGPRTALTQLAVVRASDELYYVLTYTTPAPAAPGDDALPDAATLESDPAVRRDVADFAAVTDSVELRDRSALRRDQDDRLFRTRALFANLTPARLERVIVPERWLRVVKDGKDVGYSYVVEEVAYGLPRPGAVGGPDGRDAPPGDPRDEGVRVGVRTRTLPDAGLQVDTEGWSWSAYDRRRAMWSNVTVVTDARPPEDEDGNPLPPAGPDAAEPKTDYTTEIGTVTWRDKPVAVGVLDGGGVRMADEHVVTVRRFGRTNTLPTITRDLPPFYLPDAIGQLLPRLVADRDLSGTSGSTYLFATYVNEAGEVMSRYVDVRPERDVELGGRSVRAIPVEDKLGLAGGVTTHYVSPGDYSYLGSVDEQGGVTVLPTDRATLEATWAGADLSRPREVDDGGSSRTDRPERTDVRRSDRPYDGGRGQAVQSRRSIGR